MLILSAIVNIYAIYINQYPIMTIVHIGIAGSREKFNGFHSVTVWYHAL